MSTGTDRLVEAYLERLSTCALVLPEDRQDELVAGVAEHLEHVRASGATEAEVRDALDRLGPPQDIVRAALEPGDRPARRRGTGHELAAVLLLNVGGLVLPVVGWLVGVVLLWTSQLWTRREKVLGTLVVPGGFGGAVLLVFVGAFGTVGQVCSESISSTPEGGVVHTAESCSGTAVPLWLVLPGLLVLLVAPVITAVVLYRRASDRATVTPG